MARTPLLRSIQRLFREHREARRQQISLSGLREKAAAQGPSRRQVLAGAALGAGLLALPKRANAAGGQPSIAIVGGGIAGLACALKLADRHKAATVYEASGRIGGRMFSNTSGYWSQGQISEWGGELIDTGHKTVRGLAQRFGLPIDDLLAAQPAGSTPTFYFNGCHYSKADADADFAPVFDAVTADEAAAPVPTTYDAFTPQGQALSAMTVHDWIATRVPGGHGSALGKLLDVAYAIEYGADTTQQAALNLVYLLAYQPDHREFAEFGESDERFHIRGGNQRLPEAIAAELGPAVKTGHALRKIKRTAGGRYTLTFDRGGGSVDVTADHVVLCLPFAVLRELDYAQAGFDALKQTAIRELGRGHNGKLQLQFNSRLWNTNGPWGLSNGSSYSETGYQCGWDVTRAQAGAPGIMNLYSGGSVTDAMKLNSAFGTASNAQVVQDAQRGLQQLGPVYPGLTSRWNGKATQSIWHKAPLFNASYSFYKPGQYTEFCGYEKVAQGNVLFAGEHTSESFQGFMEGGASEGERAAKELLARL